jgi:Family of unknown function (DUF5715)
MGKKILLLLFILAAVSFAVWGLVRVNLIKRQQAEISPVPLSSADSWTAALAKIKADRVADGAAVETPTELRHYSERYWFLATQVAEVEKHNIPTCQDFSDLASMIERGEMIALPAVTETFVLYGVGQRANEEEFTRYKDGTTEPNSNADSQAPVATHAEDEDRIQDFEALRTLAKNFGGRSYNLEDSSERKAMKVHMLSSLRPQALKVMEEVATAYHRQFDRPLPVSSLVRPEQYQRALSRVNRNAVRIDTPPHSTGLAFDIDYRYMSAREQNFVMSELARLKREGRIEVIRESNANYHVFVFLNGTRPADDLITASLDKAREPVEAAHHAAPKTELKQKSEKRKSRSAKTKAKKRRR